MRFSGTSASPASIACRGLLKRTFLPFQAIVPDTIGSTPNSARATSVRPEPSTPPMPKTSPLRTEKETSVTRFRVTRSSTRKQHLAGL